MKIKKELKFCGALAVVFLSIFLHVSKYELDHKQQANLTSLNVCYEKSKK